MYVTRPSVDRTPEEARCQDYRHIYCIHLRNRHTFVNIDTESTLRYTMNAGDARKVPGGRYFPTAETMALQSTKSQILALLKRSAGSTVD